MGPLTYFPKPILPHALYHSCIQKNALSFNPKSVLRFKQEALTVIYQLTFITANHNVAVFQREHISMDER